jgi:hypothetical protein
VLRRFPPLRASDGSMPSSWAPVGPIQVVTEMRGDIRVVASISTRIVARAWRVHLQRLDLNTSNALLTRKRASTFCHKFNPSTPSTLERRWHRPAGSELWRVYPEAHVAKDAVGDVAAGHRKTGSKHLHTETVLRLRIL